MIVFSDHGFRSGNQRLLVSPQSRAQTGLHRPLGMIAMRGNGIPANEWIWSGSLLDIAPTILDFYGLKSEEMAGLFKVLIARRPDNPRPKLQLANCWLALGRFDECRQILDQALIQDVPDAYASHTRGRVELMSENFDAALEHFFDVQQTYPDYQGIDTLIGTTYARMEKFEQAKMAFEKALAKNPDDEQALFGLGKHHAYSGKLDLAVESFLQAISICSRFLEAQFALGQTLAEIGERERAKIAFQRCLALQPDWESPAVELAKLDAAD